MEACNIFKSVFRDHWCNIDWNEPEEAEMFDEAKSEYWCKHINDDPKVLADKSLDWGFALEKYTGKALNADQLSFVDMMVERLLNNN